MFLTRTSCPKTAQANGYYSAWQRWAVSVYMLPLTILGTETALQRYLKFAGVGGPIIFTLPGAERLKTKPLRAAVLSHRAVFRTKRTQAVRSQTCSQGTLCISFPSFRDPLHLKTTQVLFPLSTPNFSSPVPLAFLSVLLFC